MKCPHGQGARHFRSLKERTNVHRPMWTHYVAQGENMSWVDGSFYVDRERQRETERQRDREIVYTDNSKTERSRVLQVVFQLLLKGCPCVSLLYINKSQNMHKRNLKKPPDQVCYKTPKNREEKRKPQPSD
jgi:hypothetical protein